MKWKRQESCLSLQWGQERWGARPAAVKGRAARENTGRAGAARTSWLVFTPGRIQKLASASATRSWSPALVPAPFLLPPNPGVGQASPEGGVRCVLVTRAGR